MRSTLVKNWKLISATIFISTPRTEKQKSENKQKVEPALKKSAKFVPTDFIWGRTDVDRTLSGKLVPRKRQLYQLDHGTVHKSYKTYYSIADRMLRFPDHRPVRGMALFRPRIEGLKC